MKMPGLQLPPFSSAGAPNSVTVLHPPQSLHQTNYNSGDTLPATTYYSVVQWENEIFNRQMATDHFQDSKLNAKDGMVNKKSLHCPGTCNRGARQRELQQGRMMYDRANM